MRNLNIYIHSSLNQIAKTLFVVMLLVLPCLTQSSDALILRSGQALYPFVLAGQQNSLSTYETMAKIFTSTSLDYGKLRQAIRMDMTSCRKFIKNHVQDSVVHLQLLEQLRSLYRYVKEYKECYKAIFFHEELRQRYQLAFNNPDIVQSVEMMPHLYGVESSKYKSRAYFKKVAADLRAIDKFEDTIHGDHSVLKAHNYVYKIELIRVRNYIYHNNIYKFETRYF